MQKNIIYTSKWYTYRCLNTLKWYTSIHQNTPKWYMHMYHYIHIIQYIKNDTMVSASWVHSTSPRYQLPW